MKRIALAAAAIAALVVIVPSPTVRGQDPIEFYKRVTPFTCRVVAITAVTQCVAAPAAGFKALVTDITFSNNTAGANTIKAVSGTGTNCGTGTADISAPVAFGAVIGNWDHAYATPLQVPAASAICVTPSAAISISATINGVVAP
jgi:hypothetical protein